MNSSVSGMYAAVTYVTNYTTKSDITFHDLLDLTRVAVEKFHSQSAENARNGVNTTVAAQTRSLIMKCFHGTTGQQQLSGQQVSAYILGVGDHYTS
jgi:hypothetical protein